MFRVFSGQLNHDETRGKTAQRNFITAGRNSRNPSWAAAFMPGPYK